MMNQFTARNARALMWSTALTAIAMPSLALAQAPTQPPAAQPSATQATSSDEQEIIVTAQRRRERLEDVPMTVAVANTETLEAANANSLRDINRLRQCGVGVLGSVNAHEDVLKHGCSSHTASGAGRRRRRY